MSVSEVTSSSITVQWGPVDCVDRNGDITGYSVQYGEVGSGSTQTISLSVATETTIAGLSSSTEYSIQVAAVNSAGTGPYSDSITAETEESLTSPHNVKQTSAEIVAFPLKFESTL